MKFTLRSASSAALLIGLAGTFPAFAQDTVSGPQPPAEASDEGDRVVITGSLIAGSPEDAALPVEVFTAADLEEQGAPTALEFAKDLTIGGPVQGEANFFGGSAPGAVSFNLRGIGADKTLTLLNGRRVAENTSFIPGAALARTELLKDGAAVTYGADAIGGVVNFITRDDFVGLEAKASYKFVDGSDGEWTGSLLGGWGDDNTNLLWAVEYDHRSELKPQERDWALLPRSINPAPWSGLSNLGIYTPRGALPATVAPPGANGQFTLTGEYGAPTFFVPNPANPTGPQIPGTYRDSNLALGSPTQYCQAIGGVYTTACQFHYYPFYRLVEDQDVFRAYAQINTAVTNDMDFHLDVAYGQVKSQTHVSPSLPTSRGPARSITEAQLYIPRANPFVTQFLAEQNNPATASTAQGFTFANAGSFYRTFAFQGTTAFGEDTSINYYDGQGFRVSGGINGRVGDWAGIFSDVNYDAALTYNQTITRVTGPDMIGSRIQEALNGFGGPNCSAPDLDPTRFGTQNAAAAGRNGCQWFNPFTTSFLNNPALDLNNPNSGTARGLPVPAGASSWENSQALQRWLFDERETEDTNTSLTLDVTFSGMSGLQLPGGEVGWALGAQGRQLENRDVVPSPFHNGQTPCAWPGEAPNAPFTPGYTGCDNAGPFVFFAPDPPEYQDQQSFAYFGELQIPVLDNLNFSAAVRREDFSGDIGSTVYKVSGKWDVWGPLSIRGSYGTNFQAPPVGLSPGEVTQGVVNYTLGAGQWLPATTITRAGVVPAEATAWNAGVIWQSEGFAPDHDLSIIVDYFDIETENEFRVLATHNEILNAVYSATDSFNACNHPLAGRVRYQDTTFTPGGACNPVSPPTTSPAGGNLPIALAGVTSEFGNGPGVLTNGIDYQINYSMPLFEGDFSIGGTATQVLKLQDTKTELDGFTISTGDDRLGFLNFSGAAVASPEWRVNAFTSYRFMDQHTLRFAANWQSAVSDDRPGIQWGENGEDPVIFDLFYLFDLTDTLRLTASVENITDRDPPKHQTETGYDARLGNALGRTFEIGIKSTF